MSRISMVLGNNLILFVLEDSRLLSLICGVFFGGLRSYCLTLKQNSPYLMRSLKFSVSFVTVFAT